MGLSKLSRFSAYARVETHLTKQTLHGALGAARLPTGHPLFPIIRISPAPGPARVQ